MTNSLGLERAARLFWATLALTTLWVGLIVTSVASAGPLDTWSQLLAYVGRLDAIYWATYVNATLLTVFNTALLALLLQQMRTVQNLAYRLMLWALFLYCLLNVFCYASQITLVPWLLSQRTEPARTVWADQWLQAMLQPDPSSLVASLNALAYALLGLPAMWVGSRLWRHGSACSLAGALLMLNSLACWLGLFGFLTGFRLLAHGVTVGGALYWLALMVLSGCLGRGACWRMDEE